MKRIDQAGLLVVFMTLILLNGCMGPGDDVVCPECDNVTQVLVGAKCVDIGEVAECGPDGHSHGAECHCFSGQAPVGIGGTSYCLQQGCVAIGDEEHVEMMDTKECDVEAE